MKRILLLLIPFIFLTATLSGCGDNSYKFSPKGITHDKTSYDLSADDITQIWMDTWAVQEAETQKHTYDKEIIYEIVSCINDLSLKERSTENDIALEIVRTIEITHNDGTIETFRDFNGLYFEEVGSKLYEIDLNQNQIENFNKAYGKMQTVPVSAGIVEEVNKGTDSNTSLIVSVFPEFQNLIGDKSVVTVNSNQIYKDYDVYTSINVGDEIEFYIVGGVKETYPTQSTAYKANVIKSAEEVGNEITANIPEDSNPYYVLFKELFEADSGLNDKIKYISVDMSNAKTEDYTDFIVLMQEFCDNKRFTLLEDNIDGLTEKGLIKDIYFEEGILISFDDESVSKDTLVTNAKKWRSGLGAIGAEYTLKKQDNSWAITKTENMWIS